MKQTMQLSMNGLRKNLAWSYNDLCSFLQRHTDQHGQLFIGDADELAVLLGELSCPIAVLNATSIKSVELFDDMSDEITLDHYNPNYEEGEGEDY